MSNLRKLLEKQKLKKSDWKTYPVFLRWYESGRMESELKIIENKFDYLLTNGNRSKAKEWLSSDQTLTQITAERYLLDYLRTINSNVQENITGGGVDAYIKVDEELVGIEVTTINKSMAEWILIERILTYLFLNNYDGKDTIELTYDLTKIDSIRYSLNLVETIGQHILRHDYTNANNIHIERLSNEGSAISWNNRSDDANFFEIIEKSLIQILKDKSSQLKKNKNNILFIGTNQLPTTHLYPGIFRDTSHPSYTELSSFLATKVKEIIYNEPEILGVCFFEYTLEKITPMYPINIIWKDEALKIPINL